MGRKYKITKKLLLDITNISFNRISIEEVCEKLNLSYKLMDDKKVEKAYNDGLIEHFIHMKGEGFTNDIIVKHNSNITLTRCKLWEDKYRDEIQILLNNKIKKNTEQFSSIVKCGVSNIVMQSGKSKDDLSLQTIEDSVKDMVLKVQNGKTDDLLNMLASSTMQLQQLNSKLSLNISGKIGKSLVNLEVLSKIQLKTISEMRKNILAMNDICNPKRTTFIKEANQYNTNNHIETNQEKLKLKNELQTSTKLLSNDSIEDTEILPSKKSIKC